MIKKALLMVGIAVLAVSCGKKEETATTDNTDTIEVGVEDVVAPVATVADAPVEIEEVATETEEVTETPSSDTDEWLDAYESYVTKYVALVKKAKNGDPSAAVEMAQLASEAQSLSTKISNNASTMTAAQVKRFEQLVKKMQKELMQ